MLDIIEQYEQLQKNFGKILDRSGYRLDHLAKKIGVAKGSFYMKKKRGNFNHDEMKKLLKIIHADEIEDELFADILMKARKGDNATAEELKMALH
jgi:predicted transcriptional regulator